MDRRVRLCFACLLLVQACHSLEEWWFRLWEVLAPARFVSGLIGVDPALGFAISNSGLLLFGCWCLAAPLARGRPSGRALGWGWALVETANGIVHLALAATAGGYYPGLYTAPLLLAASAALIAALRGTRRLDSPP